jgi:hypothetical protein
MPREEVKEIWALIVQKKNHYKMRSRGQRVRSGLAGRLEGQRGRPCISTHGKQQKADLSVDNVHTRFGLTTPRGDPSSAPQKISESGKTFEKLPTGHVIKTPSGHK